MVDYVIDAARAAGVTQIVAVVGHRADLVQAELSRHADVKFALQSEQKGTGHAVMMCRDQLAAHQGPVLVLAGDTPLLRSESLAGLLQAQVNAGAAAVIGTTDTEANQGLGRIVRNAAGDFDCIVEERDATDEQKRIREINTGCYAFDAQSLLSALDRIRPDNNQAEYYLTDCPLVLKRDGKPVVAAKVFNVAEAMGVNTRAQLADVTRAIQQTTMSRHMASGVSIVAPELTYIDPRAVIGADSMILPFTHIQGAATIGSDCRIGPHAVLEGGVQVPSGTQVAPFTHLKAR